MTCCKTLATFCTFVFPSTCADSRRMKKKPSSESSWWRCGSRASVQKSYSQGSVCFKKKPVRHFPHTTSGGRGGGGGAPLSTHWLSSSLVPLTHIASQPLGGSRCKYTGSITSEHQSSSLARLKNKSKQGIQSEEKPVKHGTVLQSRDPLLHQKRSAEDEECGHYNRHHWAGNDTNIRFPCYDAP